MYLGNILTEEKLKESNLFNYVNNFSDVDKKIPTLIIGWDFCKRLYSDRKLNILDKIIDKNTSWTFTKREKRIDFETDFNLFIKNAIKIAENKIKYEYINVLKLSYNNAKKLLENLMYGEVSHIYIHKNSFVYAYTNGSVIGFDLNMIDYLNIDRKKIYKILFSNGNKVIFSNEFLDKSIRENIENNYKIIPYLYAIENGKNGN